VCEQASLAGLCVVVFQDSTKVTHGTPQAPDVYILTDISFYVH
jgi:hypothetical protein